MAKIRLDIPAPPSVAGAAPQLTNYPIPDIQKMSGVHPNLPSIPQPNAGTGVSQRRVAPPKINPNILKPLDIEGKTSQLMQSQIDEGPYIEAGKAAARQGLAVANAGAAIGSALTDLASVAQALQQSKDQADISRAHNQINYGLAAFEEKAVNVPISERAALWEEEKAKIAAGLRGIGMSPVTQDRIAPEWQLAEIRQRTKIADDARHEMIRNDTRDINEEIKNAMATGKWLEASDAIGRLGAARLATPAQISALNKQVNEEKQAWDLQQFINSNPRPALQEITEMIETGKSVIYPDIKNPAILARAQAAAREAVNKREIDASEAITDGINAGRIKNKQDIEIAAGGNLTPDRIEAFNQTLAANPDYSSEAVMKARSNVEGYDFQKDKDLSQYHAINHQIATTVHKDERKILIDALDEKAKEKKLKGDQDPPQWYSSSLLKEYEDLTKNGYFDPAPKLVPRIPGLGGVFGMTPGPKLDREKLAKDPLYALRPEVMAMKAESWGRAHTAQSEMRKWLIAHPEASETEAREQMEVQLNSAAKARGGEVRKPKLPEKAAVPTAPAIPKKDGFATEEEEAASGGKGPNYDKIKNQGSTSQLDEPLVDRIKELEGYNGSAYDDGAQYSIGYGTRARSKTEQIDPAEADRRLRSELTASAKDIDKATQSAGVELTPSQRNALISFHYNTGKGDYLIESSGGDLAEIQRRMALYVYFKGKVNDGLVNRRRAELEMFAA